jgi:hypothetical protein
MYGRLDVIPQVFLMPLTFSFLVIFGAFFVISMGRFWRHFFAGFVLGITHEVGVLLFLVILPLKSHGKAFDFGGFQVLGVLEVVSQDL